MGERNGDQKTAGGEISFVTCKCLLSCITPGVVFSSFFYASEGKREAGLERETLLLFYYYHYK